VAVLTVPMEEQAVLSTWATPKARVVVPPHDPAPRIFFATAACQSGKPLQRAVRSGQPAETGPARLVPGPRALEVLPPQCYCHLHVVRLEPGLTSPDEKPDSRHLDPVIISQGIALPCSPRLVLRSST